MHCKNQFKTEIPKLELLVNKTNPVCGISYRGRLVESMEHAMIGQREGVQQIFKTR